MSNPTAAVVVFPGSNGDRDLYEAFERAGFNVSYQSASEPIAAKVDVVGLPGGFAYGDYWRAGMLASQAAAVQSLGDHTQRGGLTIGICNGFQILVEGGWLPGALRYNQPPGFRHRWLTVVVDASIPSPWFHGVSPGTRLRIPMAHGEGSYFHADGPDALHGSIPLRYEVNPNGSTAHAAALLDSTGCVLGVMPHPERASDADLGSTDGLQLFAAARAWLEENR